MSLVDDVRRTLAAIEAVTGAVVGVAEATAALRPLADAAIRGDRVADAELRRLATDTNVPPTVNAAAKLLVEYVNARKRVGTAATRLGAGVYPGQWGPAALVVVGVLAMLVFGQFQRGRA